MTLTRHLPEGGREDRAIFTQRNPPRASTPRTFMKGLQGLQPQPPVTAAGPRDPSPARDPPGWKRARHSALPLNSLRKARFLKTLRWNRLTLPTKIGVDEETPPRPAARRPRRAREGSPSPAPLIPRPHRGRAGAGLPGREHRG